MNNHESKCVLASRCKVAGSVRCNAQCPSFIAMHGASGIGGRSAATGLPKEYRLVTLENSPVETEQPKIYETLAKYITTFERQFEDVSDRVYTELITKGNSEKEAQDGARVKSFYFFSESPGTGKTTTASALINEYVMAHYIGSLKRGKQALGRPAYFLDCNDWQSYYNGFNRSNIPRDIAEVNSREFYTQLERSKKAPFLVIDDIAVREVTPGFRGDLHSLINYRVTEQLPTIYTSNVPMKDLPQVFGEFRLYDRMRDQCAELTFGGISKRGRR